MGTLPLCLMHFVLNACFHIKIHAAISLLDFFSDLNDLEHDFVLPLVNGANLAFIDYSQSDHDEILLVRTGDSNNWVLILNQKGWSIQRELS